MESLYGAIPFSDLWVISGGAVTSLFPEKCQTFNIVTATFVLPGCRGVVSSAGVMLSVVVWGGFTLETEFQASETVFKTSETLETVRGFTAIEAPKTVFAASRTVSEASEHVFVSSETIFEASKKTKQKKSSKCHKLFPRSRKPRPRPLKSSKVQVRKAVFEASGTWDCVRGFGNLAIPLSGGPTFLSQWKGGFVGPREPRWDSPSHSQPSHKSPSIPPNFPALFFFCCEAKGEDFWQMKDLILMERDFYHLYRHHYYHNFISFTFNKNFLINGRLNIHYFNIFFFCIIIRK